MENVVFKYIIQEDGWVTAEAFDEAGRRIEYANGEDEQEARTKLLEVLHRMGFN